jgi:hypothetical protein
MKKLYCVRFFQIQIKIEVKFLCIIDKAIMFPQFMPLPLT